MLKKQVIFWMNPDIEHSIRSALPSGYVMLGPHGNSVHGLTDNRGLQYYTLSGCGLSDSCFVDTGVELVVVSLALRTSGKIAIDCGDGRGWCDLEPCKPKGLDFDLERERMRNKELERRVHDLEEANKTAISRCVEKESSSRMADAQHENVRQMFVKELRDARAATELERNAKVSAESQSREHAATITKLQNEIKILSSDDPKPNWPAGIFVLGRYAGMEYQVHDGVVRYWNTGSLQWLRSRSYYEPAPGCSADRVTINSIHATAKRCGYLLPSKNELEQAVIRLTNELNNAKGAITLRQNEYTAEKQAFSAARIRWSEHQEQIESAVRRKTEKIAELQHKLDKSANELATYKQMVSPIIEWMSLVYEQNIDNSATKLNAWLVRHGIPAASYQEDIVKMYVKYGIPLDDKVPF